MKLAMVLLFAGVGFALWARSGKQAVAVDDLFNRTRSFDPGVGLRP